MRRDERSVDVAVRLGDPNVWRDAIASLER